MPNAIQTAKASMVTLLTGLKSDALTGSGEVVTLTEVYDYVNESAASDNVWGCVTLVGGNIELTGLGTLWQDGVLSFKLRIAAQFATNPQRAERVLDAFTEPILKLVSKNPALGSLAVMNSTTSFNVPSAEELAGVSYRFIEFTVTCNVTETTT